MSIPRPQHANIALEKSEAHYRRLFETAQDGILLLCNVRDVNERKRVDHLKDDFISMASHEIRNPLAVLMMGVENLEAIRASGDEEEEEEVIASLRRNVDRLEKLIHDLLDLSRFESGKQGPELQSVQIDTLIAEVIQGAQCAAAERGIVLKGEYEQYPSHLQADPELLVRVLTNLIDNAMRFAKSKIIVKAQKIDSNLQISVINDGPEIKSEDIPILFDKFVQINRGTEEEA